MERISTPCVGFCWIEPAQDFCEGCGRTRDEIAQWCFIGEDRRLAIMDELRERRARQLEHSKTTKATAA